MRSPIQADPTTRRCPVTLSHPRREVQGSRTLERRDDHMALLGGRTRANGNDHDLGRDGTGRDGTGRRSPTRTGGLDERQQVGIYRLGMRGGHAVWKGTVTRSGDDRPNQRSMEWILSAVIVRITLAWSRPPYH
jgi:hypothetical protein